MPRTRSTLVRLLLVALALAACAPGGPQPIAYGEENCDYCRMTITDARFGAELVTPKGKLRKFDSVECLASAYLQGRGAAGGTGGAGTAWVSDFSRPGTFLRADSARFVRGSDVSSPMGLGVAAFGSEDEARAAQARGGEPMTWEQVLELVERTGDLHGAARAAPHGAEGHDAAR
ncbi:MAG TPA: nitrous oxide reductase accessory protein NosL [Gemmatimonadaceae bacterium]|nr:nitrous oxide reductase accessory protein NosL [Gemmatimonadaceae bacterium]